MVSRRSHRWLCAAVAAALSFASASATPPEVAKIMHPGAAGDHRFGSVVGAHADTLAIGALGPPQLVNVSGEVCIYERTAPGAPWAHAATLVPTPPVAADIFGEDLALQGDTLLVGALGDSSHRGAVYVFERAGAAWSQAGKLTALDAVPDAHFGASVALDGDYAVFGAYGDAHNGVNSGAAYIFERAGGVGVPWVQAARLESADSAALDEFGGAVAISGDTAVVGASSHESSRGAAYVYRRIAGLWTLEAKLTASDRASGDLFGVSVAIDGDTIIVGAHRREAPGAVIDAGAAYVFTRDGVVWTESAKIIASDPCERALFGVSVALDADKAIIGARDDDEQAQQAGAAYLYRRAPATGEWIEAAKLTAADSGADDAFGWRVALAGDEAFIGAPFNTELGPLSGAVYVFDVASAPCPADLDGDLRTQSSDLALLLGSWGAGAPMSPADLDGDGAVGSSDLAILLGSWGDCP